MQYGRFIDFNMNSLLYFFSVGDIFLTSPLVTAKVGREDNKNLSFQPFCVLRENLYFVAVSDTFYHFLTL